MTRDTTGRIVSKSNLKPIKMKKNYYHHLRELIHIRVYKKVFTSSIGELFVPGNVLKK